MNKYVENGTLYVDIYFSDLTKDAGEELLQALGVESAKDMNWDTDWLPPLTTLMFELDN